MAVEVDLAYHLACKLPMQEYAAIINLVGRIPEVIRKHHAVPVHDAAAVGIDIARTRHHVLGLGLVHFAVQHLDAEGLPQEHTDKAHHEPLEEGERFYLDLIVHKTLPRP